MTNSSSDVSERRRSFRLDMEKEMVDIIWTDENDREWKKKTACLDFARGGLKFDSDQALNVDTPVTVIFKQDQPNTQTLTGKVYRCNEQDNGWFQIAILLDSDA